MSFPHTVSDDRVSKKALDQIGLWLVRRGVSFYWKIEFRDDRPHFHLLTTTVVARDELQVAWGRVLGAEHVIVYSEPISDQESTIRYVCKPCEDVQNKVPLKYRNMGRFWGTRGPKAILTPLMAISGSPRDVAKAVRPLKRLERAIHGKDRLDPGHVGMTLRDVGGPEVAEALRKLLTEPGLNLE